MQFFRLIRVFLYCSPVMRVMLSIHCRCLHESLWYPSYVEIFWSDTPGIRYASSVAIYFQ